MLHFSHNIRFLSGSIIFIFFVFYGCQENETQTTSQDYKELYQLFLKAPTTVEQISYGKILLRKAKKEKDTSMILAGYRMLSVTYKDENVLSYSDSIIVLKNINSDANYPAIAYEKKGDFYSKKRVYQRAIDNYLQFAKYAKKHDQKEMIARANYNIGTVKRRIGNNEEALLLYRKNYAFTKKNHEKVSAREYLNSITAIANVFNDLKVADSSVRYNNLGYKEAKRLKEQRFQNHFAINQGIARYHNNEFDIAIDSIEKFLPYFEKLKDYDKLAFAYYYNGKAYWALNDTNTAVLYFKKVDTMFQKTQSIFPFLANAYMQLDKYYAEKNDLEHRLLYKNQRIKIDSIIAADKIYLSKAIFKKYELPKLQAENNNLLNEKKTQRKIGRILVLVIILLILGVGFQYLKRKRDQQKFQEAINAKTSSKTIEKQLQNASKLSIPNEIVQEILIKLEAFENEHRFISNEITLNYLSKELQTNPNYLSKVINYHKKCSFSNYINNLRIDYAIAQLKTNPTYLKYTIKAIAAEVGFNNVQSFSKAFMNSKGIKPSYFIRELKKTLSS